MFEQIGFYTYGSTIEINRHRFTAGELTADLLNLSPELYEPIYKRFERIKQLKESRSRSPKNLSIWWDLNNELEEICSALRRFTVFQSLLESDVDELISDARLLTQQYSLYPQGDCPLTKRDMDIMIACSPFDFSDDEDIPLSEEEQAAMQEIPERPRSMLIIPGEMKIKWRYYKSYLDRFDSYLHDIRVFNETIHNFVDYFLMHLTTNSPEQYAQALLDFYTSPYADKLIVNPLRNGADCYTVQDQYSLSYVPRKLPDGHTAICLQHITDSLQGLMKADLALALNSGHNIRRCIVCKKYFLVKSGAHALYCEGMCPHAPQYTCRQFGTYEVQKELAKDNLKIRVKNAAIERVTKDMKRGAISREDARIAKDYVRDALYESLRTSTSVDSFEKRLSSNELYAACKITRTAKPKGRPKKGGGEAP